MGLGESPLRDGQTLIDLEEREGLRIKTISTLEELNEFEQLNIEKAMEWSLVKKFSMDKILNVSFINIVHKKMFEDVWLWAGEFRKTNKNLGVDKLQISSQLSNLIGNCKYWIENSTYDPDEIAVRFKHKIVSIHCYPNGNGRHSRLIADIMIKHLFRLAHFSWGREDLSGSEIKRQTYLAALHKADQGNILPLLKFARS